MVNGVGLTATTTQRGGGNRTFDMATVSVPNTTHRQAIRAAVGDGWQSTATIAARADLSLHRAGELLRQMYDGGELERRLLPSKRAITYEYRRRPTRAGSGVIAGPPFRAGLLWFFDHEGD